VSSYAGDYTRRRLSHNADGIHTAYPHTTKEIEDTKIILLNRDDTIKPKACFQEGPSFASSIEYANLNPMREKAQNDSQAGPKPNLLPTKPQLLPQCNV